MDALCSRIKTVNARQTDMWARQNMFLFPCFSAVALWMQLAHGTERSQASISWRKFMKEHFKPDLCRFSAPVLIPPLFCMINSLVPTYFLSPLLSPARGGGGKKNHSSGVSENPQPYNIAKLRLIMIVKLAARRGISPWLFSNSSSFHRPSLGPEQLGSLGSGLSAAKLPLAVSSTPACSQSHSDVTCEEERMRPRTHVGVAPWPQRRRQRKQQGV